MSSALGPLSPSPPAAPTVSGSNSTSFGRHATARWRLKELTCVEAYEAIETSGAKSFEIQANEGKAQLAESANKRLADVWPRQALHFALVRPVQSLEVSLISRLPVYFDERGHPYLLTSGPFALASAGGKERCIPRTRDRRFRWLSSPAAPR